MTTSLVDAESVLALDIGSVQTRALLFDVVEGQYRFLAGATAPSTADAPFKDVSEGVHLAIDNLQRTSGRRLTNAESRLVIPAQPDGVGVDRLAVTYSAGPELQFVVAGLLHEVSVESAQRLAAAYGRVAEVIHLNDRRPLEGQIDAILQAQPDLVILSGGTEHGATRSVGRLVELITLVCRVLPQEKRPHVLYVGNSALSKRIEETLEKWTVVHTAPNVRPSIDVEALTPAQEALNQAIAEVRYQQMGGLQYLGSLSSTPLLHSAPAFGRLVRFSNLASPDPNRGALGVDLGAGATTVAASVAGKLHLSVLPYGMGGKLSALAQPPYLTEVMQWLPSVLPEGVVKDYLCQKSLHPGLLPVTEETQAVEFAAARVILRLALRHIQTFLADKRVLFEPIIAAGGVLGSASPIHAMLMLLDGLQPVGVTTPVLDQYGLATALGAIAPINSILPVQALDSGALLNLGAVISPITTARYGSPVLDVRLEDEQGSHQYEVRQGAIVQLPVRPGQVVRVHLRPLNGAQIGPRQRGPASYKLVGGACRLIIDARGRPLKLPPDDARRRDLLKRWRAALSD